MANDYNKWAEIVISIWKQRLVKYHVGEYKLHRKYPSHLFLVDSFTHLCNTHSNGNTEFIQFMFNLYGRFVDMGVGRQTYIGNPGDVKTTRKRKLWYSHTWFSEVSKLQEFLQKEMGNITLRVMEQNLGTTMQGGIGDIKYKEYKNRVHKPIKIFETQTLTK